MEESDKDEDTFFNKYIKNGINANWTSRQRRDGNRSAISPSQGQSSERKEGKRRSKTLNSDKKCVTIFFQNFQNETTKKETENQTKESKLLTRSSTRKSCHQRKSVHVSLCVSVCSRLRIGKTGNTLWCVGVYWNSMSHEHVNTWNCWCLTTKLNEKKLHRKTIMNILAEISFHKCKKCR